MRYKQGEQVVFHKDGHAYDGCVVRVVKIITDDNKNHLCNKWHYLVEIRGHEDVNLIVNDCDLLPMVGEFKFGDVVTDGHNKFLYCRVLNKDTMAIVGNTVNVRGEACMISKMLLSKVQTVAEKIEFFKELKQITGPEWTCRFKEKVQASVLDHIEKIIQELEITEYLL